MHTTNQVKQLCVMIHHENRQIGSILYLQLIPYTTVGVLLQQSKLIIDLRTSSLYNKHCSAIVWIAEISQSNAHLKAAKWRKEEQKNLHSQTDNLKVFHSLCNCIKWILRNKWSSQHYLLFMEFFKCRTFICRSWCCLSVKVHMRNGFMCVSAKSL